MGYYIQTPGVSKGKAQVICDKHGAYIVACPARFDDVPRGTALICVVNNGPFEAAGFCCDPIEFKEFTQASDTRSKIWLYMDWDKAAKLSGLK